MVSGPKTKRSVRPTAEASMLTASMGPTKECLGCDRNRKERSQQPEECPTGTAKSKRNGPQPTNKKRTTKVRTMTTCPDQKQHTKKEQLSLNSFRKGLVIWLSALN